MPCTADLCSQGRKPCPRRRVCFPDIEADEPVTSLDEALSFAAKCQGALLLVVIVCAGMAVRHFFF